MPPAVTPTPSNPFGIPAGSSATPGVDDAGAAAERSNSVPDQHAYNSAQRSRVRLRRFALSCQRSIASGPTTAAGWIRCIAVRTGRTRRKPTASAGTGSIGAIRTTRPDSLASGSRAKDRRSSASIRRCRSASRSKGLEVDGAWGTGALVAPERDSQGLDEALAQGVGSQHRRGPDAGRLGRVAPNARPAALAACPRAAVRGEAADAARRSAAALADGAQPPRVGADSAPVVQIVSRSRPLRAECEPIRRFDSSFSALWERLAPKFDLAVRRDAPYLNWRYIEPPHVRYSVVALRRQGELHGYAVYRHRHEPLGRVTMLVDFLVDPDDVSGLKTLLRWVDRAARAEDADKVRCYVMHGAFRRVLRRNGYFNVKSTLEVSVKVNAVQVPKGFLRRNRRLAHHVRRLRSGSLTPDLVSRVPHICDSPTRSTPTSPPR